MESRECPRKHGWDGPCPWVSCRKHLWSDNAISRIGNSVIVDEIDPIKMEHTCSVDVAMKGPNTLKEIADLMGGITKERVRQIECKGQMRFRIGVVTKVASREVIAEELYELERTRKSQDDTMWSDPGLDGRIERQSFGKMVSKAQAKIVPEHARRYYVGV